MEISQGGGIFRSANIAYDSADDKAIKKVNEQVIKGFGLKHGAAHSEYIKCKEDGKIYFLETSSRVIFLPFCNFWFMSSSNIT